MTMKEMMLMNRKEVREILESITSNSKYLRVSNNHPLELYLGKNQQGFPTLRYNGEFVPVKIIGNSVLEIKQVQTSSYHSILFTYNSKENNSLFYDFCADLINQTENYKGDDGYKEIVNRYIQWKKMFNSHSKLLSEQEVLGLIGELLFLKDYAFKIYGITNGLNGWSGPEPTHKDFSYDDEWFEIKSINSSRPSFTISSIEQLDSVYDGKLYLYTFEKMSPSFDGVKLNNTVKEIMQMLEYDTDKDLFTEKLKQVGYCFDEVYDSYVYNLVKLDKYCVNKEFPRIVADELPKGISRVQYDILISMIEKFKEN